MARSENLNEISFDELFEYGQQTTICDYRCENCKRVVKEMKKLTKYSFSNNQYLIVRISNSIIKPNGEEVYFKTKILNFNENCVSITGDASGTNFKLNSAICFQPTNESKPSSGGHYTTWSRLKNHTENWIHISDTLGTIKSKFINNLQYVSILFLSKKS